MTTTTDTFALPLAPEFKSDISYELRSALHGCKLPRNFHAIEATEAGYDVFFEQKMGLSSKEDYLAFRENLKAWLRVFALSQKEQKAMRKERENVSSIQCGINVSAYFITMLIDLRRASKAWAGRKMRAAQEAASKDAA